MVIDLSQAIEADWGLPMNSPKNRVEVFVRKTYAGCCHDIEVLEEVHVEFGSEREKRVFRGGVACEPSATAKKESGI